MSDPLMIDGHALESEADEIIATLMEVMPSHVALIDLDENRTHLRMSSWWFSHDEAAEDLAATVFNRTQDPDALCVGINRRWNLLVVKSGTRIADDGWIVTYGEVSPPSIGERALIEKTAQSLARFLPATSRLSDVLPPPDGTGSGGSGSAELGIPVWWARKVLN